ncbi:hypothetical protein MKW98_001783 [Papaver atlanticum]|uniref:Uncharacterized protein n=1 Tax=Papaver atlanticum TaxID=357466 RepID=A0AAD4S6K6_9MAGN|nr:hypothetical protein MKW98_001783 [Papaver atlanticum]
MNDSDARLRFFVDCYKLREATTVVEVGCNFKDVGWCIRNKHLFLLDNLRNEKKEKLHDYELQVSNVSNQAMSTVLVVLTCFTTVDVGLLEGRRPLLEDVDVTINPSKGLSKVYLLLKVYRLMNKRSSSIWKFNMF